VSFIVAGLRICSRLAAWTCAAIRPITLSWWRLTTYCAQLPQRAAHRTVHQVVPSQALWRTQRAMRQTPCARTLSTMRRRHRLGTWQGIACCRTQIPVLAQDRPIHQLVAGRARRRAGCSMFHACGAAAFLAIVGNGRLAASQSTTGRYTQNSEGTVRHRTHQTISRQAPWHAELPMRQPSCASPLSAMRRRCRVATTVCLTLCGILHTEPAPSCTRDRVSWLAYLQAQRAMLHRGSAVANPTVCRWR